MIEQLLPGRKKIDYVPSLWIDPSNLATGATAIVDRSVAAVPITNSGVVVANVGPFTGDKSLYFTQASLSYLRLPADKMINLLTGDITIEYWWRPETRSGNRPVIAQWRQSVAQGGFICLDLAEKSSQLWVGANSENAALLTLPGVTENLAWEHIRYVRAGDNWFGYRNGKPVSTVTNANARAKLSVDWGIGMYFNGSGGIPASGVNRLNGWLTKIKVYDKAINGGEFTPT